MTRFSTSRDILRPPNWLRRRSRLLCATSVVVLLPLLAACQVEILHDLDEKQANAVLAALQKQGMAASKSRVARGSKASYTIDVSKADAPRAWQVLRQYNLPQKESQGLGEVFGKSTLVPTAAQQRALMRHALAGEITRTLQAIAGVSEARVHVVIPHRDPLSPADKHIALPRASVLLKVQPGAKVSADEVKRLVAGSIASMNPGAVQVVMSPSTQTITDRREPAASAAVGPFLVAAGSRSALLTTLVGGVLVILVLGLLVVVLWVRLRRVNRLHAEGSFHSPDIEASLSLMGRSIRTRGNE